MRGVRSFMNWHKVPEFETVSSTADDNPFAGARVRPTGKVSVKLLWTTGCVGRCPVLTLHSHRATKLEIQTIRASSEISSLKLPDLPDGTGCMLRRTVRVQQYAPGHRTLPNSTIPSAG